MRNGPRPNAAPVPQEGTQPQQEASGHAEGEQDKSAHAEARKWRKQLRATEQERVAHAQTVRALQRQAAEKKATRQGIRPKVLWSSFEVSDLLNEDALQILLPSTGGLPPVASYIRVGWG